MVMPKDFSRTRRNLVLATPLAAAGSLQSGALQGNSTQPKYAVSIADWGARGGNAAGDAEAIQRAFDEAPIGAELHFPPGEYRITQPLRLTRRLDLVGHGAYLVASFRDENLLTINIENQINRDNRNQRIQGLNLFLQKGSGNTISITNYIPNIANIGLEISGNTISAPGDGAGNALSITGLGTHHISVLNNQIENGVFINAADGITLERCLIFGIKPAIKLDMIAGSFQTRIFNNCLVSRDGALIIKNGSQVYFTNNTIEQFPSYGKNKSKYCSHVEILPDEYRSRHIFIVGNNFGGGDNVDCSIYARGQCQDIMVDNNVFNVNATDTDIILAEPSVEYTRIGPNNTLRGPASRRPNVVPGNNLVVRDEGTGTYGLINQKAISPAAPWKAGIDLAVYKTLENVLYFKGTLVGNGLAGSIVARLGVGFRPFFNAVVLAIGDGNLPVPLSIETDGTIKLMASVKNMITVDSLTIITALPSGPYPNDA